MARSAKPGITYPGADCSITLTGLGVHKETIAVTLAEGASKADVREYRRIANNPEAPKELPANQVQVRPETLQRSCGPGAMAAVEGSLRRAPVRLLRSRTPETSNCRSIRRRPD